MFPNTEGIPVWMFEMEVTGSQSQIVGVSSCSSVLCGSRLSMGPVKSAGSEDSSGCAQRHGPRDADVKSENPSEQTLIARLLHPPQRGWNVCSNLISCLRMVQGGFSMVQVQMLQMISLFHLHTHLHGANSRFMYWSGPQPIGYVTCITTFHESCICTYTMNC